MFKTLTLSTSFAASPTSSKEMVIRFGAGVNLSLYEHTWSTTDELYKVDLTEKIHFIAKKGFKTIRLPVAFDMFLQPNSSNVQQLLIEKLKKVFISCNNEKLNLIITYHYGKLSDENSESTEIERIAWIWKQVQFAFKGICYDNLFFELYNEPTLSSQKWKATVTSLVNNVRWEDDKRLYIIGGTDYNSINELMNMGKIQDKRIIYTFHFYEPFIFTHQGADWTNNRTKLTGLPFPYKKSKFPKLNEDAIGTDTEKDYKKYSFEATPEYLSSRIEQIATFCSKNNMPVICTETGVIVNAKNKYRKRYLKAVTKAFLNNNVRGLIWDYDQKFAIKGDSIKVFGGLRKWIRKSKRM